MLTSTCLRPNCPICQAKVTKGPKSEAEHVKFVHSLQYWVKLDGVRYVLTRQNQLDELDCPLDGCVESEADMRTMRRHWKKHGCKGILVSFEDELPLTQAPAPASSLAPPPTQPTGRVPTYLVKFSSSKKTFTSCGKTHTSNPAPPRPVYRPLRPFAARAHFQTCSDPLRSTCTPSGT
ncbi:hypothetical protein PLICRDRAFT_176823 [Plicaturopsis crispa FD-325 SS-3]|nr:hypothetical protein PLICRDRAFT_176823 [Plicaturopsis crispa FD-325 SS-3]